MNLDELQIKISIELDDLNKQLKNLTKSIEKSIGPKATEKLMKENHRIIKRESIAINKTLNKAFDINLTKFNSNITSAMNQARQTVRSACNDIRRELNAALNINGNIRVTSKTSISGSATGSTNSNSSSSMASSQYIGAMIIKATNAIIKTNNTNTKSINSHIDKATNKIVSAIKSKNTQSKDTTINVSNDNSDIVSAITRLGNFNSEGFRAISGDINKSTDKIISAIKSTNNSTVGSKAGSTNSRGSVINDVPYIIIDDDTEEKIKQIKKDFEALRIESGKVNFNLGKEGPIDDEQIKKMRKAFEMARDIAKKISEASRRANTLGLPAPKQDDKQKKKPPYKKVTVEQGVPVPVKTTSTKPKPKVRVEGEGKEVIQTAPEGTTKTVNKKDKSTNNEKILKALSATVKTVEGMGKAISAVSKGVKFTKEYADKTAGAINKVKEKRQTTKSPGVVSSLGSSLGKVTGAIAEPTVKATEVVIKDLTGGLKKLSDNPDVIKIQESVKKIGEATDKEIKEREKLPEAIKETADSLEKINSSLKESMPDSNKIKETAKAQQKKQSMKPIRPETPDTATFNGGKWNPIIGGDKDKLIDDASELIGEGLNNVVSARDIANAILNTQISSIQSGKYGQHKKTGPSQAAEVLPAHLLANITEGFEGPLDDLLQVVETALTKAGIKLTAKIASKIGPMIYNSLVEQDGDVDRAFKVFQEDLKRLFTPSKGAYDKITPEMVGAKSSTISPQEANTKIQTNAKITRKNLEAVKADLNELEEALRKVQGKEILDEGDIDGLNGRLRTTIGKLSKIDDVIAKLRSRNNELAKATIPGSDLNIESSKNSSEIAQLYDEYAKLFQLRLKYGKSIKELEDKIKVNIDTSEAEHNLNNLKKLTSDLSKTTPDLNAEDGMEDYHRKQMGTILDANAGEVGAFTKNLKLEAFTADIAKLNSRLDAAADDLMEVIRTLGDLGGSDDLKKCEEILRQLSQTDLSHLNRDIKKLAESVSGANFDTSAIKKLQDRLTSLQQVRNKVSMIRSKAARGKGIDEEALKVNFRAIKDSNNAVFGEGGSDSLGFSAYRIELEKLAKLAETVGSKIKEKLGNAFSSIKGFNLGNLNFNQAFDSHVAMHQAGELKAKLKEIASGFNAPLKKISTGLNKAKSALNKFASGCKGAWAKITSIFRKGANDCGKAISPLKSTLSNLASMFGLYQLGSIFIDGTKQAIKYEASLMTIQRTLGGASKTLIDFANNNAQAFGISKSQVMEFGNIFSVIVSNFEKDGTKVAGTTQKLLESAGVIAGATGYNVNDVLENLRSGILGSSEAVDQLGLNLKVASLEASNSFKQIANGAKSWNDLTEAQKQAIIAQEIINQTTAKYGGIVKNTSSMHNAFMAQLSNTKLAIGKLGKALYTAILPALTTIMAVLEKVFTYAADVVAKLLSVFGITVDFASNMEMPDTSLGDSLGDSVGDSFDDTKESVDDATEAVEKFKGSLAGFDEINILSDNTPKAEDPEVPGDGGIGNIGDIGSIGTPEITDGEGVFDKLSDKMKAFLDEVIEPFKNAWDLLGERWKQEWGDLVKSFEHFCTSLATFLKSVWDNGGKEFVQHMAEIGLACGIAAMEIGGEILDSLARLWEHLDPSKNMNTQGFLDALNEVSVKIRDFILGLGDHFESLMANGGQDVLNALGDCFMNLGEAATRGIGIVIDALDGLLDHLDPANNAITQTMLKAWEDAFHAVGQMALDIVGVLESVMENGGQDVVNAIGDLGVQILETFGNIVEEVAGCVGELFKHMDPAENDVAKGAIDSFKYFIDSIRNFVEMLGDTLGTFMDNGGQEFVNNLGDIIALIGDLAFTIGGDIINAITTFMDSWAGQMLIEGCARALELISEVLEGLLRILEPLSPIISGVVTAIGGFIVAKKVVGFIEGIVGAFKLLTGSGGILALAKTGFTVLWGVIAANPVAATVAAIVGIGTALVALYNKCEWFRDAVNKVFARIKEPVEKLMETFSDLLENVTDIFGNIIDVIVGIFEGDGYKVGEAVRNMVLNIIEVFKGIFEFKQDLAEIGWNLILGLIEGIWECIKNIPQLLAGLGEFVVDFFKGLFGIHSPSTVFKELGINLIEGLIEGIESMISNIGEIFTNLKDSVVGWVKDIVDGAIEKWSELKGNIVDNLSKLYDEATEKWKDIYDSVSEKCKNIYEDAKEKWGNVKKEVSDRCKDIYEDTKKKWDDTRKDVAEKCKNIYDDTEEKWTNIKNTTGELVDKLKSETEEKYSKFRDNLTNTMDNWRSNSEGKWSAVKSKTNELVDNVKSEVEDKYGKFRDNLTEFMENWRSNNEGKWDAVKGKTTSFVDTIKGTVEKKYGEFRDNLTEFMEQWRSNSEGKWDAVKGKTFELVDKLRSDAEGLYNTMKSNLGTILDNIKTEAGTKWENIKATTNEWVGKIVSEATNKFGEIKQGFLDKIDEIKNNWGPKWDSLKTGAKTKAESVVGKAKEGFSGLSGALTDAIDDAKDAASKAWGGVKDLFSKMEFKLPSFKLPKVKIEWATLEGNNWFPDIKYPKLSWNARGGIIDGITPLGFANGALQMGGESGKEMVVPLENTSFTSKIAQAMGQAVDNAMARNMNSMYGSSVNNNNDSKDIVLKVNERELARASINSINKLQRESGRTLLDI
jgi:hypothetical protein